MSAAEIAGHGLHLALFAAGLVMVAVLLLPGRRRGRTERARLRALRRAARAGTLADVRPPRRD